MYIYLSNIPRGKITTYVSIVQYFWMVERTMHCRILFSALLAVPFWGDGRSACKGETLRLLKREMRVKAFSLVPLLLHCLT